MIPNQFRNVFVKPVLEDLAAYRSGMCTPEAIDLIMGTAAVESDFEYWEQLNGGPAVSLLQIEPDTAQDNYDNFIDARPDLKAIVDRYCSPGLSLRDNLLKNPGYAVAHARVWYWRQKGAIPKDVKGQSYYWKNGYNTAGGHGHPKQFVDKFNKHCL